MSSAVAGAFGGFLFHRNTPNVIDRPEWAIAGAIYKIAKSLRIASFDRQNSVSALIYATGAQAIFSHVKIRLVGKQIFRRKEKLRQ
jgi:hypothetical protein